VVVVLLLLVTQVPAQGFTVPRRQLLEMMWRCLQGRRLIADLYGIRIWIGISGQQLSSSGSIARGTTTGGWWIIRRWWELQAVLSHAPVHRLQLVLLLLLLLLQLLLLLLQSLQLRLLLRVVILIRVLLLLLL